MAVLAAVLLYTLGNRTPGVSDPRPTVVASQPGTAGTVALPAPGDLPVAGSAQDQAVAAALGLDRREQLIVVSVATDPNGAGHVRYRRTFDGLRVVGGDFVAHLDAAGVVRDVSWNLGGKVVVPSTTPTITLDEAKAAAAGPRPAAATWLSTWARPGRCWPTTSSPKALERIRPHTGSTPSLTLVPVLC